MNEADSTKCIVKVGAGNRPCGKPSEYLNAGQKGSRYSGWRHTDGTTDTHHAVPAKMI